MVGNLILACLYLCTVEPRYNEPLDNEVLGTTNDFLYLRSSKNIFTKVVTANQFSPVPWPFDISRYHCTAAPPTPQTKIEGRGQPYTGYKVRLALDFSYVLLVRNPLKTDTGKI